MSEPEMIEPELITENPHLPLCLDYRNNLRELVGHHIYSFNYMVEHGIKTMIRNIKPVEVVDPNNPHTKLLWFENPIVDRPHNDRAFIGRPLLPFECRQAKISYTGDLLVDVCFECGHGTGAGPAVTKEMFSLGQLPIMLKSTVCNLRDADPAKLVSFKEDSSEMGGYFIINGIERVFRLLTVQKRNYPTSMVSSSFRDRSTGCTDKATVIRCVREDQAAVTLKLHYIDNGSARVGFWLQGKERLIPVGIVLKALIETSDREICESLDSVYNARCEKQKGSVGTEMFAVRALSILNEVRDLDLYTHRQCLEYIGEHFRPMMVGLENETCAAVADAVLRDFILVHLDNNHDKFNLLIFMLQKLFSLVDGTSVKENPDALQNQEILLPGHLITILLKEKLEEWLLNVKRRVVHRNAKKKSDKDFELTNLDHVKKVMKLFPLKLIASYVDNFIRSGNLYTALSLELPQRTGFTGMAYRHNFLRFLSQFSAVHRGASFVGLHNTSARKVLPESWGFICPVNTPTGVLCGLVNHMTISCSITSYYGLDGNVRDFSRMRRCIIHDLVGAGMSPISSRLVKKGPPEVLSVVLDGRIVGTIRTGEVAEQAVSKLRRSKRSKTSKFPHDLEVGYIPHSMGGAYPGLYLFTSPSRFLRPVRSLLPPAEPDDIELIGPFEQVFMDINCPDGGEGMKRATHEEINLTGLSSLVASLTPFSEHNHCLQQVYQCQNTKQTMGFSAQAINRRADYEFAHLQTPQRPIVSTGAYESYGIDEFPLGTNAIVAVTDYSGYDMGGAVVLNKSSVDRGFCQGFVYQTKTIDVAPPFYIKLHQLPYVGQKIEPEEAYCYIHNEETGKSSSVELKKGSQYAVVDYVAVHGQARSRQDRSRQDRSKRQKVTIRLRYPGNPTVGDKFSNRHGQKSVCSKMLEDIDMPFSGFTGMRPDLIISPHSFPESLPVGMMLEIIAAKGGCLGGFFPDGTPFSRLLTESEAEDDVASFLAKKGYNYIGTDVLYSGTYGVEMKCRIFIGPAYYQRLSQMVADKLKVCSTGVVDRVTRQPLEKAGAVRFGEMEKDALLAHGAAYLLHDRLHKSSDYHIADVCKLCGSVLTASVVQQRTHVIAGLPPLRFPKKKATCVACESSKGIETVAMPYVFRYLASELAAMNIRMTLQVGERDENEEKKEEKKD